MTALGDLWPTISRLEPMVIEDVRGSDTNARGFQRAVGDQLLTTFSSVRSWMGVPLAVKGRALGLVALSKDVPGYLTPAQVRLAMALRSRNAHYEIRTIRARHWHDLALRQGGPRVWRAMRELVERVAPALDRVGRELPKGFPERIRAPIFEGLRGQAALFLADARGLDDRAD